MKNIRIATRNSPLALWQAEHVRRRLLELHPGMTVELVRISTEGDRILDAPLITAGGKGLFVKELEQALRDNTADIAVHSMKDVTVTLPAGMALPVILERGDVRDVFISTVCKRLEDLPAGARIGTSSLRRECQLHALRPDLQVSILRGNVGTRLRRLEEGRFDAILLAAAGVARLGYETRINHYLDTDIMLPAPGQGAIGIETRAADREVLEMLVPLDHPATHLQVQAERAFSRRLYGGCRLPIAAHALITGSSMTVRGLVGRADGSGILRDQITGDSQQAEALGEELAEKLVHRGADVILRELTHV
ncbi:MAG: hydroxymethylbilane synthase [Gammaproteobacteria bacterium]